MSLLFTPPVGELVTRVLVRGSGNGIDMTICFRFGKHKGVAIHLVPSSYVSWYLRQEDPDPYLVRAFNDAKRSWRR